MDEGNNITDGIDASFADMGQLASTGLELGVTYGFRIVGALLILLATWFLARWARSGAMAGLRTARIEGTLNSFLGTLVRWGIMLVGLMATLSLFGIETTSLAAIVGGAGIAVGLAIQGNLANFAAGIVLLIVRPFQVGDWVAVGGAEGIVDEIGLFTTRLDTLDRKRIFMPNNTVLGTAIENRSFHDHRRVDVMVGVEYDTDLRRATQVLTQAMEAVAGRLPDRPVLVRLEGYGDSSINFRIAVWGDPKDFFVLQHEIIAVSKEHLDAAGIGIPFPQVDLHLDKRFEELLAKK